MIIAETEVGDLKYRISQQDEINVVLEKFDPPHIGKRGRGAGKMTQGKWLTLGYYGNAQAAAKAIVTWGVAHVPGSFQDVIFVLNELERKFENKVG
tara:strand:- start:380 stop:667 length:288 start_codon:yes stop_codon:yes gene_type:complete